ncbi:MAG: S1 RNA-binding domain-containing protein [Lachnospiraceae bacterium]|nr:S1 RNA-binding domain-containing protein [Lachnospiraceae bacterium]
MKVRKSPFELGCVSNLVILRFTDFGAYLGRDEYDEESVLLPKKNVTSEMQVGDRVNAFIYRDSSDRVIATTDIPKISINRLSVLTVKEVSSIGAFLDWGLEKDLLLPYREMEGRVEEGDEILVRLYRDKSDRLAASMKGLWKYLSTNSPYRKGDVVNGRVYELGHNFGTFVAVDDKYNGMIPRHEKLTPLAIGDKVTVRVTDVKEDGKLDLSMREDAYKEIQNDGDVIMDLLDSYAGVLPFTEKATPEVILRETGMSKAAFKRAIGHLYKERKISLTDGKIKRV